MAYIDEVVEKNKRYLTQAQVDALVSASRRYNVQNAGTRASVLASAREQYDTGYRGLQNMGLAGGVNAAPTSGEVPRLKARVQVPMDQFNRTLQNTEQRRLSVLGDQYAAETKAEEERLAAEKAAREAAERAAAERAAAERARQQAAAQQAQRQKQVQQAQAVAQVVNKNRPSGTKGITAKDLTTIQLYDEPYEAPEKPATRAQTVQSSLAEGLSQAVTTANAQAIAAAKVLGISSPANKAVNKVAQTMSPVLDQKTGVAHTDDERQTANNILQFTKDSLNKGIKVEGTQKAEAAELEAAMKKVDAYDKARKAGGSSVVPEDVYNKAVQQRDDLYNKIVQQRNTADYKAHNYSYADAQKELEAAQKKVDALASVRDTSARPGAEEAYQQAVRQRDVAKLKAEDPVTYSFLVVANSDLDAVTKKKAGQQFVDKAFTDDKEDAAQKFRSAQETVNRMEAELAKEQKEKEKASEDRKNMKEQVGTALYNLDAAKESGDTSKIHEARKALYAITDPNTGRGFDEQSARSWYWVGDTEEPKLDEDKYKYYKSMLDIIDSDYRTPEDKALLENAPDDFDESKAREYVSWFESETAPKQEPEKLRQAKEALAAAELRYKYPDAYKAMQIYQYRDLLKKSNPDIVEWADEKIASYRMQEMGLKAPAMTDEEYTAAKKDAKGIQNALRRIENAQSAYDNAGKAETEDVVSDKEHAKNELDAAVREMQEKYGMTKEEAEAFMERFETEKDARMENDYYRPGMIALLEHQGETPTNAVNRDEIDQTYRMVNDLPWMAFDENEGSNYTSAVKWMTPEQKDAYNAIYEKDGIDAANQYFKDITPYLYIQRATADEAFYKEVADRWANKEDVEYAKENWYKDPVGALSRLMRGGILADIRSVGANLLWNAPATMERLIVGAKNALGGSKYYDVNSDWSFRSGRADIIRSERSQNILNNMSRPEWVNNVLNFAYQTGMSMADSGVAMAFAYAGQEWMVDALFFSSAGNAAYKEAKERGATQQQAMEIGILSGAAEAIFEHASIEHFMRMDYKGKGALVKNLLSQATAEGSEEVSTEIANILTDVWVMRDKSQYAQAVKDYKSQGMSDEQAQNRAFMDQLASIGMAGFGGAVSGALFGLGGAAVSSVKFNKEGKRLNSNTQAKERVIQLAEIMGGKAQESLDVYNADKTDRNLGELSATVQQNMLDMFGKGKEAPDVSKDTALEMNAGSGKQVDLDAAVRDQIIDKATAYSAMLSGDRMSTATAKAIMDVLGKELLNDMGYNTSSSQKFASSYNQRLDQYGIQSRADAMAGFSFRQRGSYLSPMQQTPSVMGAVRAGSALTQAQERYTTTKDKADQVTRTEEATTRVWKDPNLGYVEREDGKLVRGLPGNMTSVPYEEQKKNKFAARITAKAGRATYAIAGMEALEGLSNEQKISELKKNMTKEALGKAEFLEQLAPAMKLDMVIHDDLGTADGYVDDNGVLHISLSSKKSILRVTSHELLHEIRQVSEEHYQAIKDAIIKQVGQEEFDKKVAQKAEEYRKAGVTLSQNGAEEETIAEYSERMLSDTDWLEDFVEKNPDAARTLGDVLLKIINAIKKAFKRIENRNYGTSWSQEIEYTQDTLQAMYDGLEAVMARRETKAEVSTDRRIADETKATERATEQAAQAEADELYRSADDIRAEEAKKAAEESAKKKTYVPGFKTAEVERVLEAGVFGDKSNYEGDDYEQARAMIAQLIPDMVSLLKKEGDIDAVVEKTKAVVGKMLDNYFEDEGDMAALREAIPSVIGVDSTAKTDLKAQDTSLFQMSAKLSKALGHPVTLVSEQNAKGQKNAKYSSAEKLEEVWERVRDQFGLSDDQDFSIDTTKLMDFIEQQADTRKTFNDLYGKQRQEIIASTAVDILQAVKDMYSEKTGQKFSLDTDAYREKITNDTIESIRKIGKKSINDFDSDDIKAAAPFAVQYNKTFPVKEKSPFFRAWFGEWRANSVDQIGVADMPEYVPTNESRKKNRGTYKNTDTGWDISVSREGETNTISHSNEGKKSEYGLAGIKQLVEKAILFESEVHEHHQNNAKNDMIAFDHKLYALGQDAAGIALYRITVEEYFQDYKHPDKKRFHNLKYIEKVADFPGRRTSGGNRSGGSTNWSSSTTVYTVADLYSFVNKYDKEFTPGRKVNPAFLNEDGTPKVFYHGTSETFDAFDRTKGRANMDIQGMFFSPYEIEAGGYGENVGQYYLSIRKPASEGLAYKALNMFKGQNNAGVKAREYLEKLGYDGVVGYDEVIAFEPTQIKSATDNIGTFNKYDERYRFSIDTDYLRLAEKYKSGTATEAETQQLQEAVEQAAKDAGYSDKMYHGSRKGGGFTVFKGWQYFTPNEAYAKRYAQRDNQNSMYQVYVKADNYFDTRKADAKRLFEKYRQEYGLGELQENGLPDWTDGYDLAEIIEDNGLNYDGIILDEGGDLQDGKPVSRGLSYVIRDSAQIKSADPVTYDDQGNIIPLSERFNPEKKDIRWSLDTDAAREARQAFTVIDTAGIEDGLEALKNVKNVGAFAMKDISRFLDAISHSSKDEEANKNLRNTLSAIFEKPHSEATGRYARGVERMQQRVLDIGAKAGVCDEKGGHFDSKKSAAIQNIGEGFSNTYTDLKLKVKDADRVTVRAYEPGTDKLVVSEKDYTLKDLRQAYGTNVADFVWSRVFDETQKAQATGKESGWLEETVNTRPYTLADLQDAFPNDWQKLKTAADEFRQMYDEYIRDQNSMLRTIYPIASEYDSVEKVEKAIAKKQERLTRHKVGVEQQLQNLQRSLEAKEKEMASKKRTDTKAFRNLVEQANRITDKIAAVKAEIAEYEANINEELAVMNAEKAQMQNAVQSGESLKRMHRLQYRSDYFHHFQEMASGVQNLKAIFTNNTDISPAIVGRSENTKAKSRWAGYYQQRMGADYTADAMNGMLRYGQLAEYKLAFDPLVSYLRNVTEQIRTLDDNTNRDGLIKYLMAWTDNIAGKSHRLDRLISDAGMAPRKAMQVLNWINSRVIQNTLLFNMRSSLIQISNITNAKGIVTNNLDWFNGLRCWAAAAKGNEAMQAIMAQSNFLASRYMDNLELTDSALKSAKKFAGWLLGALDEVSAKATWWAAYTQYQRNPNAKVIQNAYRTYDNAIDYADDVTRRTHAGRGVGELAPAMTSRVINFVAPFQVEINNTFEQFKDNVKRGNYLGLLSTGLSVFLFNAAFEAIVGSSPLQFDFIRAVLDIVLGFKNDDPDEDDDDYGLLQAWQRIAGEGIGSLPFAGQLVSIIGEDTAKKIFGEDNDATRYGNTQIGVSAVTNAGKGLYDIGKNLIEGKNVKQVNWISDLDDLVNLTLPMGGKQLTRSIQGLYAVAQGYGGKNSKEGEEQVQFVTDQDILHYIHAGLFGKWSLTEASEYFGEERLLPKLFGAYEGPKSSIGKAVDAKEYKAALAAGIDGKDYFSLKYDLKGYTTQSGKRSEMMEQSFTPEQKAQLDALLFGSKDAEMKAEGAVVYQKSGDDWKVKADYTNQDMFDLSQAGDKVYTGTLAAMEKTGLPQDQAVLAANMWDQAKEADDSKTEFRNLLRDNDNLTVAQKEALDLQYCGNKYAADYSDPDLYELSITNRTTYEKAKKAKAQGIPVKNYVSLLDKKNEYSGEDKADYMRREIMKGNLTAKQKELLDDLLVSDQGRNPDYSSPAWFEISMLGGGQYQEAKEGAKIGLKPETYLTIYNKWKTLDAKDENGKTVNGLKKKRAKEYLDGLTITAPEYDYIWTVVFGYKTK